MKRGKYRSYMIQAAAGLALSVFVLLRLKVFDRSSAADIVRGVCDAFTVPALLFCAIGILIWISTTDFFDIFGFAFRKGLHHILPFFAKEDPGRYYEYKQDRSERRSVSSKRSTLIVGLCFLVISIILTFVWYGIV